MKRIVKDKTITKGPEWVDGEVREMWNRIIKNSEETGLSYPEICRKYNFSSSALYSGLKLSQTDECQRDTEIRVIEAFAKELNVPLNYLVHGDNPEKKRSEAVESSILNSIFEIAKGDLRALFIMTVPYLSMSAYNSVREDIISRFE